MVILKWRKYDKFYKSTINIYSTYSATLTPTPALIYIYIYIYTPIIHISGLDPEGTKRATSANVQLPRLQKDLRSISRDLANFPSELCRPFCMFMEVARLAPPDVCSRSCRAPAAPGCAGDSSKPRDTVWCDAIWRDTLRHMCAIYDSIMLCYTMPLCYDMMCYD